MLIQEYLIHLTNGNVLVASEPYALKGPQSLISRFENAKPESMFCVGDALTGFSYFPARSIVYINTGDVREIDDKTYNFMERMRPCGG